MLILGEHQINAIKKLKNGSVLVGGVGTGKSRTALSYYMFIECKGSVKVNNAGYFKEMKQPKDLYIITTAKKRDDGEWIKEAGPFGLTSDPNINHSNVSISVDSWNNINKYTNVSNAFFIFDEQRVVGYGSWTKAFLKIASKNKWILLSATPADKWTDLLAVFIANGFYRNKTEFYREHVIFNKYCKYPRIDKFINIDKLIKYRNEIYVVMKYDKSTNPIHKNVYVPYDKKLYNMVFLNRWNVYDAEPIRETGKLFYLIRKVVNSDKNRVMAVSKILDEHPRVIIFYNFDYELYILRELLKSKNITFSEWNGQKHQEVPIDDKWVYLVQYSAGAEGWNCITTNVMIFYSRSYSYRMTTQAAGRIDRLNTQYKDLYYYHITSKSPIDIGIEKALKMKKDFNESKFLKTN